MAAVYSREWVAVPPAPPTVDERISELRIRRDHWLAQAEECEKDGQADLMDEALQNAERMENLIHALRLEQL